MSSQEQSPGTVDIVLAEDSATQALVIRHGLERNGFRVETAGSGEIALGLIKQFRPRIIISDLVMPGISGYDLCRAVKGDPTLAATPVLLLTALTNPAEVLGAIQSGADGFMTKPCPEEFLANRVRELLDKNRGRNDGMLADGTMLFHYGNRQYTFKPDLPRIINLLISTYETAFQKNIEYNRAADAMAKMHATLKGLAVTDLPTGLLNQRGFLNQGKQQLDIAEQLNVTATLFRVVLAAAKTGAAIDLGKAANDFAVLLRQSFHKADLVARLSDGEFAVLCLNPTASSDDGTPRLQSVATAFNAKSAQTGVVVASCGRAAYAPRCGLIAEDLLEQAGKTRI